MKGHGYYEIGLGVVTKTTDRAIKFAPDRGDDFWVPRSVVHEDSEVPSDADEGHEGKLAVKEWWAKKEGY